MKLRGKFTFMTGIPILGMALIFILGLISFNNLETNIHALDRLHVEYETMINGDRDAYQAFVAQQEMINTLDLEELRELEAGFIENVQQAWDRTIGPSENFTEEMQPLLNDFRGYFNSWRSGGEDIIRMKMETVAASIERDASSARAIEAFEPMRQFIDELGLLVEEELASAETLVRRSALEQALSLTLNGDRDAYQAYVDQLLAVDADAPLALQGYAQSNLENITQTQERLAQAVEIVGGPADQLLAGFNEYFERWKAESRSVVELTLENFEINERIGETLLTNRQAFNDMRNTIDLMGQMQEERTVERMAAMEKTIANAVAQYIAVVIVVLLASVAVALYIAVSLLRGIRKGVLLASSVSKGDLNTTIDIESKDEIGTLAAELRGMVENLKYKANIVEEMANKNLSIDIVRASDDDQLANSLLVLKRSMNDALSQVQQAVAQVKSGADQVSQASGSLSQGATEQASSLEEITSSTTEINSQSKQNAENATKAYSIARQATEDAENGNRHMKQLSEVMAKINASSDAINKVVKVIDDIAFQINLLALNANVEAARAGKYGKGFAVVAEEVRNLAVKSAEAVKETTSMVEDTVKNIRQGNEAADITAQQLDSIVKGSGKVADFLEEIAQASREQAQALEQITEGLDQIDQTTQASTASAEESASASEELAGQAQQLRGMVAQFMLEEDSSGRTRMLPQSRRTERVSDETGITPVKPEKYIRLDETDFDHF